MSNEARHRDIAAPLARGVIRVKKQPTFAKTDKSTTPSEQASIRVEKEPLVAKAIESQMPAKHDVSNISQNPVNNDSQATRDQSRDGGDE